MLFSHPLFWAFAACLAALILGPPKVRHAFLNGGHCLARHPVLWQLPAGFALAYALFETAAEALLTGRQEKFVALPLWTTDSSYLFALPDPLPVAETLAADFNCLIATFPLAALAALAFLANRRGAATEMRRSLGLRLGPAGYLLHLILLLAALAAVGKPILFLALPELAERLPFREFMAASAAVNALSFVFEYLLGTGLQVYLTLTAYGWIRGLSFSPERLIPFAVRRLGFVAKWMLIPMTASLLLIHLPVLGEAIGTPDPASWTMPLWTDRFSRPLLAVLMLVFATVPIRLTLHNDSLKEAIRHHFTFVRRHSISFPMFLAAAALLGALTQSLVSAGAAWQAGSVAGLVWMVGGDALLGALGGWILAAWVCFYQDTEKGIRDLAC